MPIIQQARALQRLLITYIRKLNVYTEANDDPPGVRENQILATRFYLILLLFTMLVLVGYTALSQQTLTVEGKQSITD